MEFMMKNGEEGGYETYSMDVVVGGRSFRDYLGHGIEIYGWVYPFVAECWHRRGHGRQYDLSVVRPPGDTDGNRLRGVDGYWCRGHSSLGYCVI